MEPKCARNRADISYLLPLLLAQPLRRLQPTQSTSFRGGDLATTGATDGLLQKKQSMVHFGSYCMRVYQWNVFVKYKMNLLCTNIASKHRWHTWWIAFYCPADGLDLLYYVLIYYILCSYLLHICYILCSYLLHILQSIIIFFSGSSATNW